VGRIKRGVFYVRAVRFGKLHASYEMRDGEQIRALKLEVAERPSRPDPSATFKDLPGWGAGSRRLRLAGALDCGIQPAGR
jgi:hypothetical protein